MANSSWWKAMTWQQRWPACSPLKYVLEATLCETLCWLKVTLWWAYLLHILSCLDCFSLTNCTSICTMCFNVLMLCVVVFCCYVSCGGGIMWWCACVLYTGAPSPPRRAEHRVWRSDQRVRGVQIRGYVHQYVYLPASYLYALIACSVLLLWWLSKARIRV